MKLLFVDFSLPYLLRDSEFPSGGWAVQLKAWLAGLSTEGHRCGVLTWKGANAYTGPQALCELLESYDPNAGVKILKYAYLRIPAMLAAARAWQPDAIIQSTRALDTGIMAFIAARLGVPFVYRIASDADVDERRRIALRGYERFAYGYGLRRADLVVCQNAYQAAQMRRQFPARRLHVQSNIFHLPPNAPQPRPRGERSYVAWLGVFRQPKNLPLLLATARRRPSIEFRVAGVPAADIDRDSAQALEGLRTLPNVRFTGYLKRTEVPDFLACATALLCTSHYEGFSNTFLEAFAAGTPVITRKGVDPDSIVAGCALGRVAADDPDLAECIRGVNEMAADRFSDLALRCRRHVEMHHAPGPILQSLVEAIRPLLRPARG